MVASHPHAVEDTRRIAGVAALGMATSMLFIPFPILLGVILGVRPPAGAEFTAEDGVAAILAHPVIFSTTGISFFILGCSLIVLALALHERLRPTAGFAMLLAAAAGVIGGALLMLVGVGPLTNAKALPDVEAEYRVAANLGDFIVAGRLTTGGMFMFGAFAIMIGRAGLRAGLLGRALSTFGVFVGAAIVVLSALPAPFPFLSGPIILVWSTWLGISLLRQRGQPAQAREAATARV